MSGIFALLIAFIVMLLAMAMKVVSKTSDSRSVFQVSVLGFILIYILAALAISWLNPSLPRANVGSFSNLFQSASPRETAVQDTIIRE